ncbi:MAG TPA: hypothetical protein VG147_07925 [Solirubrobacteraceae bacterium]|jgi:hypothetical protein|nr:hypothetical protein [Solirubrobacteraceae bacterium]
MIVGTADHEALDRALNTEDSALLKSFGFDPGIPVYDIEEIAFDVEELKRALFESDYDNPVTLIFQVPHTDAATPDGCTDLPMVVELIQASYESYQRYVGGIGIGRFNSPVYYLRGYLYTQRSDRTIPMHIYLTVGERNVFSSAIVQIVIRPSGADPSEPLRYGRLIGCSN